MASAGPLSPKAVSAPGKVLLAGGYLVLDRDYTGLVFGLDARIHVCVEPIQTKEGVTLSEIIVKSPQFKDAQWEFGYRLVEADGGIELTQLRASHDAHLRKNPFIETALTYALTYISSHLPSHQIAPASLSILASPAYYSNPGKPPTKKTQSSTPSSSSSDPTSSTGFEFLQYECTLRDAHKTGLGSSAALVTAFTAALLSYYLPKKDFDIETDNGKRILHNLAQAAHCAAQGKIGSGFDVASAVYGSCLYRRFSPSLLADVLAPGAKGFASKLRALIEEKEAAKWDVSILRGNDGVKMPTGLRLVMCDVDVGTATPGMVKKLLAWRSENKKEAGDIWNHLQQGGETIAAELTRLASSTDFESTSTFPGAQDTAGIGKYAYLRSIIENNRALIRHMSGASGVPIEPPQQTALLDACTAIPGVVAGVVPGAGGYDAIVLLIEDREDVFAQLKQLVGGWKGDATGNDSVKIGKVGILGVREDMVGVKSEDPAAYTEWAV